MTKVQVHFRLPQPLDESLLPRLNSVHTLYGIQKINLAPSLDRLMVEYDASRLRPAEVEAALTQAGIPVEPAGAAS
jgi:hypothetical protein